MSLIQAALNRAQNPVENKTEPKKNLESFDREVEAKIGKIQKDAPVSGNSLKNRVSLFLLLAIFVITGVIYGINPHRPAASQSIKPALIQKQGIAVPAGNKQNWNQVFKTPRAEFVLSGIARSGKQPFAVVNNQIVQPGEKVDKKALVKDIGSDYVMLEYNGESLLLKLKH